MRYNNTDYNSEFIAGFENLTAWYKYVGMNKHWGLTKEQAKELYQLCKVTHSKKVPLAGESSENAGDI